MNAFHSYWTKPGNTLKNQPFLMEDYEVLTMILSALKWREYNGPIQMLTDSKGAAFFEENGLSEIWDLGIRTELDENISEDIDPFLFWAAGKLYSLKSVNCPCVMLDTDLIIWKSLKEYWGDNVIAAHSEGLNPDIYPAPETFVLKNNYHFPEDWDWSMEASNTAFLYMPSNDFKNYYVDTAIGFMKNVSLSNLNPITAMCSAEQRFLSMCGKEKERKIEYLLNEGSFEDQNFVTHVWGYKRTLKCFYKERTQYCKACIKRIIKDYPQYEKMITDNRLFQYYCQRQSNLEDGWSKI